MSRNRVVALARSLIRINSENPPGRERPIALFAASFLKKFNYQPKIIEFAPGRSNLVAGLKAKKTLKRLLLTPHLDTVPAGHGWKNPPFLAKKINNRIYGRGASDCKGNLAVGLEVLASLKEQGPCLENLEIVFAACADEETGSRLGFKPLLKKILPLDYALVLDASGFEITYGQKGLMHLRLMVRGKKAHGAEPEKGVNAIEESLEIFRKIKNWAGRQSPRKEITLNIGKIEGGEKVNIVAGDCFMDLDLRFRQGLNKKLILREIKRMAQATVKKFSLEVLSYQEPVKVSTDNLLCAVLKKTLKDKNIKPQLKRCRGATVLNFLADKNIPSLVFGFASKEQAHCQDEYITTDNLKMGAAVLKDFLINFDKALARKKYEGL